MEPTKICAFTGHRPQSLPFGFKERDRRCKHLKKLLRQEIESQVRNGVTHFISGMALGIDTYAAEIVLDLKKKNPNLVLEAALPCETQAAKWSEKDRKRYFKIIEKCDIETLLQKPYTSDCMLKRNQYMVNQCDVLIAVWNGLPSGTGKTVEFAKSQNKTVVVIDVDTL